MNYLAHLIMGRQASNRLDYGPIELHDAPGLISQPPLSVEAFKIAAEEFDLQDFVNPFEKAEYQEPATRFVPLMEAAREALHGETQPRVPTVRPHELRSLLKEVAPPTALGTGPLPGRFIEFFQLSDGAYALFPQDNTIEPSLAAFALQRIPEDSTPEFGSDPQQELTFTWWDVVDNHAMTLPEPCALVLTSADPDGKLACRRRGCAGVCEPDVKSVQGTHEVRVVGCNCC